MRPMALIFGLIALGGVAAGAYELSRRGVARFEETTRSGMTEALTREGLDWAEVGTDGLIVVISGEAPDEAARVRALAIARSMIDEARVVDRATVTTADPAVAPKFSLEILRDGGEVSLIGLVPAGGGPGGGRASVRSGLENAGLGGTLSDMLQTAEGPVPAGWDAGLALGLRALREAPRSKVSVTPGEVRVAAAVEDEAARRALEGTLRAAAPDTVTLKLDITAPRPVITPFRVDFVWDGSDGGFEACAADSPADAAEMAAAARDLGAPEDPDCAIGLGAPTPEWTAAVVAGLRAVGDLGGGRFAIKDVDATLTGPEGVDPARLAEAGVKLRRVLPEALTLNTILPPRTATGADGAEVLAPRFDARLTPDGRLSLGGALQNATSRDAVESYAAALVGHDRVENRTAIDPSLPDGWPGRVLVGVAALAELREGIVEVTPDQVLVRGIGVDVATNSRVRALLAEKLGEGGVAELGIAPPPAPAPATAPVPGPNVASDATGAVAEAVTPAADAEAAANCAEDVTAILGEAQIGFAPSSAEIDSESEGTLLAIADVLRSCPRGGFEVGGHTDAQGSSEGNLRLSQRRAEAVVEALRSETADSVMLTARGYGEEEPVASNETEEGRALNRRITFLVTEPEAADQPAAARENPEAGEAEPRDAESEEAAAGEPEETPAEPAPTTTTEPETAVGPRAAEAEADPAGAADEGPDAGSGDAEPADADDAESGEEVSE